MVPLRLLGPFQNSERLIHAFFGFRALQRRRFVGVDEEVVPERI
jgi:hypothetical protein